MARLTFDISVSLDGFVAGPDATLQEPLGKDGEGLHEWVFGLESWRERHGLEGGETGPVADLVSETLAATGAVLMGRKMFSGGSGPWADDPNADAWWGDEPPFRVPVFVLTHHARERVEKRGGTSFTFVTDGIESALEQARAAAGDKDVNIAGGAEVIQQYLAAGLVDGFQLHVAPVLLGGGVRLFDSLGADLPKVEATRVVESPQATHVTYRIVR
jgi:dihydrofolate reductase